MNIPPLHKSHNPGVNLLYNTRLRLTGLWHSEGRCLVQWSALSKNLLARTLCLLQDRLKSILSPLCTHVKGRGGVKGTVDALSKQIYSYHFVARFDIASYYNSMQHSTLLELLNNANVGIHILEVAEQYLKIPDLKCTGRGMVAGGSLSPLLGALYLQPLDAVMQQLMSKNKIYYVRYMDDMVILAKTRWHLRCAIRILIKMVQSLGLELREQKKSIGRVSKGFDFLGYQIHPSRKLRPSPESLKLLVMRARRLYEQKASIYRLWQYVSQWSRWLWGGLDRLISLKGGVKRYMVFVLKQLKISGWCLARVLV